MINELKLFINKHVVKKTSHSSIFDNIVDFEKNYSKNYKLTKFSEENEVYLKSVLSINKELNGNFTKQTLKFPVDYILELENEKVYGKHGLVIADGKVINQFNILYAHLGDVSKTDWFSRLKMPSLQSIEGSVAVMTSLWPDFYYHWMLDILPKFHMLKKYNIEPDYYLLNSSNNKFQQFCLKELKIPEEKIIYTNKDTFIQASKLIIPSIPGFTGHNPEWAIDFVRKLFLKEKIDNVNYPKKIYISRKKAFSRRFVNEEEVERILKARGFKEVELENLDIFEQAKIFYNADTIFSPHGGGLTNIIFSKPNTKVIEVFSPAMPIPCYWYLCSTLNLQNYHLMAEAPKKIFKENGKKFTPQDIILDIDMLIKTLDLAD